MWISLTFVVSQMCFWLKNRNNTTEREEDSDNTVNIVFNKTTTMEDQKWSSTSGWSKKVETDAKPHNDNNTNDDNNEMVQPSPKSKRTHRQLEQPSTPPKSKTKPSSNKGADDEHLSKMPKKRAKVKVTPVRYAGRGQVGDFGWMIQQPQFRNSVMLFNDNLTQWAKFDNRPGGGNACVRPYQHRGDAIGVPTGPFESLTSEGGFGYATAKDVIDASFERVVKLFLSRPDKVEMFFSVNPTDPPGSTKVGLGIFAGMVGDDVMEYISDGIQRIPAMVEAAAKNNIRKSVTKDK